MSEPGIRFHAPRRARPASARANEHPGSGADMPVRMTARAALGNVLGVLTPDDYGQLDAQAVPALCRLLRGAPAALAIDVLDGLEKVGDGRAVDSVARLGQEHADGIVRQMAARVLPVLQARQQHERETGRLLRASSPPDDAAKMLLHPVRESAQADGEALVRPATVNDRAQEGEAL